MKCKNCYGPIKKSSNICDYCGTPVIIEHESTSQEEKNNNDEVLPVFEEDRLSPEFRQILGTKSSQKRSLESGNFNNLKNQAFESNYFEKKTSRNWGVGQTIFEFVIYCVIVNLIAGYPYQQDVVVLIYLLWSGFRAFNSFVLKSGKQ